MPDGVVAELYVLKFNFIEKQSVEILPGQDEYSITFKYNNNTADTTIKVHENEFVPRPTPPTKAGYSFAGWYTDESFTNAWNFDVDVVKGDWGLRRRTRPRPCRNRPPDSG